MHRVSGDIEVVLRIACDVIKFTDGLFAGFSPLHITPLLRFIAHSPKYPLLGYQLYAASFTLACGSARIGVRLLPQSPEEPVGRINRRVSGLRSTD